MKVISRREFDENPAEIMEAVEAGETYHVTRDGAEVAELRPPTYRKRLNTDEVIDVVKDLPRVDYAQMRAEADEFFVYIDLAEVTRTALPQRFELTTITMAELQQGVAPAKDATDRSWSRSSRSDRKGLRDDEAEALRGSQPFTAPDDKPCTRNFCTR